MNAHHHLSAAPMTEHAWRFQACQTATTSCIRTATNTAVALPSFTQSGTRYSQPSSAVTLKSLNGYSNRSACRGSRNRPQNTDTSIIVKTHRQTSGLSPSLNLFKGIIALECNTEKEAIGFFNNPLLINLVTKMVKVVAAAHGSFLSETSMRVESKDYQDGMTHLKPEVAA